MKLFPLAHRVADLPYLDAKTEYIHESTPGDILDGDAPTISLVEHNTLASLHAKLAALYASGSASGFPLVAPDGDTPGHGERMYAYIASKELEHGLARARARGLPETTRCGFAAAEALARVRGAKGPGVVDIGWLADQAPLTVNARSPMELLHEVRRRLCLGPRLLFCRETRPALTLTRRASLPRSPQMFVKLGIRYAICTDERGLYLGVIEKNRYLHYLRWLEKRAHGRPASLIDGSSAHADDEPERGRMLA